MRLTILLFFLLLLAGCTGTSGDGFNSIAWQAADPYQQGSTGTLKLTDANEGTMESVYDPLTSSGLGLLFIDGSVPVAIIRSNSGEVLLSPKKK
jgi:hypothetical protein